MNNVIAVVYNNLVHGVQLILPALVQQLMHVAGFFLLDDKMLECILKSQKDVKECNLSIFLTGYVN